LKTNRLNFANNSFYAINAVLSVYLKHLKRRFCDLLNLKLFAGLGIFLSVFQKGFGKLVGAGGIVAAAYALQYLDDLVDGTALCKPGYRLQAARTAADELKIVELVVFDGENDFSAASAACPE